MQTVFYLAPLYRSHNHTFHPKIINAVEKPNLSNVTSASQLCLNSFFVSFIFLLFFLTLAIHSFSLCLSPLSLTQNKCQKCNKFPWQLHCEAMEGEASEAEQLEMAL